MPTDQTGGQSGDEQRIRRDERRKVYKEEQAGWLEAIEGVDDATAFCWSDVAEHFGELLFALDAEDSGT